MPRLLVIPALLGSFVLLAFTISARRSGSETGSSIDFPIPTATASPEKKCVPCRKPDTDKPNSPPNVTDVKLDKVELRLPCPSDTPGNPTPQASLREMMVEVATTAEDIDDNVLTYVYTTSGGRIVGTGRKVSWNLSAVKAGTYEIVAGADDGCGICGTTGCKKCRHPGVQFHSGVIFVWSYLKSKT